MPKLNGTHIAERLRKRLAELEAGEEVAAKDIRALLTEEQNAALEAAWAEQEQLRTGKRARSEAEQQALGIKSKRELRIAAFKSALQEAEEQEVGAWEERLHIASVRQARIYFEALKQAAIDGKDKQAAENWANNELTRAGLRRMDRQKARYICKRNQEVNEMEDALMSRILTNMTAEGFEQVVLGEQYEKATAKKQGLKN